MRYGFTIPIFLRAVVQKFGDFYYRGLSELKPGKKAKPEIKRRLKRVI